MIHQDTCPKCNSKIRTKLLGVHTIEVKCKCPHEADYHFQYNKEENATKDAILKFQEERKNAAVKEVEEVKVELSQVKKELEVHEEEPEFSTIEEAELSQYRMELEAEDDDEERMESDAKKMQHAEIRKSIQGHTGSGHIYKIKF